MITHASACIIFLFSLKAFGQTTDPLIWLEDAEAPAALQWADQHTSATVQTLQNDVDFANTKQTVHDIAYSPNRLPKIDPRGGFYYNLWQDADHPHGIYRRTTPSEFKKDKPAWEVVFDVDALVAAEGVNWVLKSVNCLEPAFTQCLLSLSNGGGDAVEVREYDMIRKAFVQGGFKIPNAKTSFDFIDKDNLLVATDYGPGSLTTSGYARILKRWHRGEPLAQAKTVMEVSPDDLGIGMYVAHDRGRTYVFAQREIDINHTETFQVGTNGHLTKLNIPSDTLPIFGMSGFAFLETHSDYTLHGKTYVAGTLLAFKASELGAGVPQVVFEPDAKTYLAAASVMDHVVYLSLLDNVQGKLLRVLNKGGKLVSQAIEVPPMGTLTMSDQGHSDKELVFTFESFLVPRTYYSLSNSSNTLEVMKRAPSMFDATAFQTEQFEATSLDGTKIPYFIVHKKGLRHDGTNPTLLYAYGGFEVSQTPFYSSLYGKNWLEKGGVFVLANIHGGAKFGPTWHTTVLKKDRHKVFEDFIAVAEDLISTQVTNPKKLGIQGGSNGGLLVGTVMVERPDLFKAVVCEVPLLDMIRFPLIGAGASWESEYGDPADPAIRAAILGYSPYQNAKAGVSYPKTFFMTSRTDDRVGPAHARKLAAKLEALGQPVLFYEDSEGGHEGSDTLGELVESQTLVYTYLYQQLMR